MFKLRHLLVALCVLMVTAIALADTIVLKDGTTVEGTVIKFGNTYRVKLADGQTRIIPEADVKQVIKGGSSSGGAGTPRTPAPTPDPAKTVVPGTGAKPASGGASLQAVKGKADRVEAPIIAVSIWEKFIETNPSSPDIETAKAELAGWQKLQKDEAEKINGRWIGGEDLKKTKERADKLIAEGAKALDGNQTVQGLAKLEEALKVYPYSFPAHFHLGYYYLTKGAVGSTGRGSPEYQDKAIKSLEAAAEVYPQSAATWSNVAIAYNFRRRYAESVQAAYKAAKIEDSKDIVQNLVNSIAHAPGGMQQNNAKLKPIMEDTVILARKHGINLQGGSWLYIPYRPPGEGPEPPPGSEEEGRPGPAWSGSGFFVTADGYVITNHHVATGDAKQPPKKNITFRVRMDDGTEKNAELIAVDDNADIALMKIKPDSPVPYLKLAENNPNQAAKALVLGYPATGSQKHTLQISEGQVKSINTGDEHEVWFDLNTTHGNSGGPIVDKNGRVIAILTAGRTVYNVTYVLGVGPKQIRAFLDTLGEKTPPVEWDASPTTGEFDGEKLTEVAKKSTVLIIAIRGAPSESSTADSASDAGAEGDGKKGAVGATP